MVVKKTNDYIDIPPTRSSNDNFFLYKINVLIYYSGVV